MATVEQLLVQLGLNKASIDRFIADVEKVKGAASAEPVSISVQTDAGKALATTRVGLDKLQEAARETTTIFSAGVGKINKGLDELRTGLTAVGIATGIGLAASIGLASEEANNLSNANVILNFTAEELRQTQEGLRAVADETGLSFQRVSATLFDVASAGFVGAQALEVTSAAARVAAAAGGDVTTAFNAIATAMTNFGISADEAGDKLVRIADVSRATLSGIADALGTVGPVAAQFGVELDEVGSALAFLTTRTGNSAESATQLNSVIQTLLAPTKDAAEGFKELGITVGENAFQGQTLIGILETIANESAEAGISVVSLFSNVRALKGAAALLSDTEQLRKNIEDLGTSAGRAQQALNTFFEGTGPQLQRFRAAFTNLLTVIGEDVIEALRPTIQIVTDFILNNRQLIASVIEATLIFGGLVAAIAAARFAYRQISAAIVFFNGLAIVSRQGLQVLTQLFRANTAATAANTAAKEANAVIQSSSLLRAFAGLIAILKTEVGVLIANTVAWIKNTAARVAAGLSGIASSIAQTTTALAAQTTTVGASTSALTIFSAALKGTVVAGLTSLISLLGTAVTSLSALTVGLGVGAAAFAGFKLGRFISEVTGLDDAIQSFTKSRLEATQAAEENILSEQQAELLEQNKEVLDEFNRILRENTELTKQRALAQALDNNQRLAFLQNLEREGRITAKQAAELANLTQEVNAVLNEQSRELRELTAASRSAEAAQTKLTEIQEEFNNILESTRKELVRVRRGEEAVLIQGARDTFLKRIDILKQQSAAEVGLVRETQAKIASAVREGVEAAELQGLEAELQQRRANLQRTLDAIANNFEIFNAKITAANDRRIQALRDQAQREIKLVRDRVEEVIKEEQRQVDASRQTIDELRGIRDEGIRDLERFINDLRQRETERIDPALGELRRLEQTAQEVLVRGLGRQAREALGLLREEIELLAGPTEDEVRALESLAEVNAELTESTRRDEDIQQRLTDRRARLEAEIAQLQELRADREIAAQETLRRLQEASLQAEENSRAIREEIRTEQQGIVDSERTINTLKAEQQRTEIRIGEELEKNIERQNRFANASRRVLEDARRLAEQFGKIGDGAQAGAGIEDLTTRLDDSIAAVERFERATSEAQTKVSDATTTLAQVADASLVSLVQSVEQQQQLAQQQQQTALQVQTQADELARANSVLANAQQDFSTTVDDVLREQNRSTQATTRFAETTSSKLGQVANSLSNQSRRLNSVERQIARLTVEEGAAAAAAGL